MATKNLARTVVEGGRDTYSKLGSVVGGCGGGKLLPARGVDVGAPER